MALAAVFFALPFAIAFAIYTATLDGLGLTQAAILYVAAGGGTMTAFLAAASLAAILDGSQ